MAAENSCVTISSLHSFAIDFKKHILHSFFSPTQSVDRTFYLGGVIGCGDKDKPHLLIDLREEIAARRFLPEQGDKLHIAGNANDWNPDSWPLEETDQNGVYRLDLGDPRLVNIDTLEWKALIRVATPRPMASDGWESIGNRVLVLPKKGDEPLTLTFNQPYREGRRVKITFAVDMRNMQVLGWFDPDAGDQVAVSGSFMEWSDSGIELLPEENGTWKLEIPVYVTENANLEYKFRINPGPSRHTRNQGWEQRGNRYVGLHPSTIDTTLPTAWFDDRTRILRVQIKDSPSQQLHLEVDGVAKRSPMLVPVGKGWQETALQIPETVAEIKLMNPTTQIFLTPDVPLEGAVVVMEGE